jgi:hypothetical protein
MGPSDQSNGEMAGDEEVGTMAEAPSLRETRNTTQAKRKGKKKA